MTNLLRIDSAVVIRRQITYGATIVILFLGYLYLRNSSWLGDILLHTLMETVATVLSFFVGCIALVRFYSRKNNTFLFIGTGFVATAFLDGYHALVTSSYFINAFPSTPPSLIAWSWFASRIFLAILLWLSWIFWRRENRLGATAQVSEYLVYTIVCVLAVVCFTVVALAPMPAAYHHVLIFLRPQEIVPALFFLLALIGYLYKGQWKSDPFEHWLVLSLIVGFMGQAMFMSFSGHVYDMMFDAAHLLKDGSYICVLVGLLFNMYLMYSESLTQQELAFKNTVLSMLQEVSQDAILLVNEQGQIISCNHRFVEQWNLPQKIVDALDDAPILRSSASLACDPEAFFARVEYLYEHKTEKGSDELKLKDGRIIDRYSAPIFGENGRYYGRGWFFRDITERKNTEQKMRELQQQLRDQTIRDPLTGLFNRRYLDEISQRELTRAKRSGYQTGFIMCDLDRFKAVNDAYGHLVGDDVLRVFAAVLKRNIRGSDIAYRYGGEEFLLMLPELPPDLTYQRAEQLRTAFEATLITSGRAAIHVTASFGVASFPEHGSSIDELISAADEALYMAKNMGRNRVVLHPLKMLA